ncbi:MAG: SulP family inorganic anion transporter, partial [Bacteroidia bacterium]|nr:SulP family inorganic anion transporter [Bacteroidia bacterium]
MCIRDRIHIIAGITPPGTGQEFGGLLNFLNIPRTIYAIATQSHHALPALLGIFTIGMLIGWEKVKPPSLRLLPSPLMAIGLATGVTVVLSLPVTRIQVPSNPLEGIVSPLSHSWELLGEREVWLSALTLAFVASTESLLSATAVDSLQNHAPRTQYNRVLWGEGAGNILCGLLGLLPVSGVIVRSSANILAGARTRLASILHGVWLLIGIWAFPSLLNHIPLPALAALLAYTGLRLINYKEFLMLWRVDRAEAILFLLTMGTIVATDLFVGIVVGVIGALLSTLNRLSALEIQRTEAQPGHIKLEISGAATFLRLPQLAETLEQLPARSFIHIHTDGLQYLDYTCADYLYKWYQQYTQQGGKVVGISRFRIRRWHRRHRKK